MCYLDISVCSLDGATSFAGARFIIHKFLRIGSEKVLLA